MWREDNKIMNKKLITKFLNTTLKKKFPDLIDEVIISENEIFRGEFYLHAYIVLNKYENIKHSEQIKEYVEDVMKYTGIKLNQISFSMK